MVLGYTLGVYNMLHNPKRVKKSKKHAKKTEMWLAFERAKSKKKDNLAHFVKNAPFRKEPPE